MMLLLFITPMMVQAKNGSSYCLWISASPDPTSMPESRYRLATQDVNAVNHGESDVAGREILTISRSYGIIQLISHCRFLTVRSV